ncbi:MAG: nitroreductase/quinone reductase family protein [Chloroflexota bacterium]
MSKKYYARPSGFTKAMNSVFAWMGAHGIGQKKTVKLEVKGRKSGQMRAVAVNTIDVNGQRYLVAPRGDTEWSRNARVNPDAVITRGKPENVTLTEVPVNERAPIIQAYLRENAIVTKREFGVDPKADINVFEEIADKHPVFKVTPRA